jgi:copper ion binding protein
MAAGSSFQKTISLPIKGMHCASCVGRVEQALKGVPGVADANVNLATERAQVRFDGAVETQSLITTIEGLGYAVPKQTSHLAIDGMTCAGCVRRVEQALLSVPGVSEASVNLATERAAVTGNADIAALIAAVCGDRQIRTTDRARRPSRARHGIETGRRNAPPEDPRDNRRLAHLACVYP